VWVVGVEVPVNEAPLRREQVVTMVFACQINTQVLSFSSFNKYFLLSPNRGCVDLQASAACTRRALHTSFTLYFIPRPDTLHVSHNRRGYEALGQLGSNVMTRWARPGLDGLRPHIGALLHRVQNRRRCPPRAALVRPESTGVPHS